MADTIVMEPEVLTDGDAGQSEDLVETPDEPVIEQPEDSEPVETEPPSSAYEDEESASKDPIVAALLEKTIKDREARLTQSFKDRQTAAVERARAEQQKANYDAEQVQASNWRQGQAFQSIHALLQSAEAQFNEGKSVNDVLNANIQGVQAIAQRIDQAATAQTLASIVPAFNKAILEVFPNWTAPPEIADAVWGPIHRHDLPNTLRALALAAADAADKDPKRAARIEAEVRERLKNDGQVQAAKTAAANRNGRSPTLDVPAGGSRRSYTLRQIDAMPMTEWMNIPQAERTRLLDEAHQRAARG